MKKILLYSFILIALVGFFSPGEVGAQVTTTGCYNSKDEIQGNPPHNFAECQDRISAGLRFEWKTVEGTEPPAGGSTRTENAGNDSLDEKEANILENNLTSCNIITRLDACIVVVLYYSFYVIPSLLTTLAGKLLNSVLVLALNSTVYSMDFVFQTWKIVRDLSNIFFILILLYIAVKMILGLGGAEVKKMVARVIIIALLINFSMFFTKVVIDSSNILALIFYNKLTVKTLEDGTQKDYDKLIDPNERDVSGAMFSKFDPAKMLTQDFFNAVRDKGLTGKIEDMNKYGFAGYVGTGATIGGVGTAWLGPGAVAGATVGGILGGLSYLTASLFGGGSIPSTIMAGIIVTSGMILIFTMYAFFMAALSFIGRTLELWVLIIFSPFAFMSSSIPMLEKIEYIGWDAWFKRLLKVSFMAPIFMFFMYFIFQVINSNLWVDVARPGEKNVLEIMLLIILPALFILILLLQAVSFAKKGSGKLGEMLIKGAKVAGGLVAGGALGGVAFAGRTAIGGLAAKAAESNKFRDWAAKNKYGEGVSRSLGGLASSSFDFRTTKLGGSAISKAGLRGVDTFGKAKEGGFIKARDEKVKRQEEFADKMLDTSERGKAELTRGGMGAKRAQYLAEQMMKAGMAEDEARTYEIQLRQEGIAKKNVSKVARYLDAVRRDTLADRLEKRSGDKAKRRSSTKRIAANKVRKDVETATKKANLAEVTAALAAAANGGATGSTTTGGTTGGTGGGTP